MAVVGTAQVLIVPSFDGLQKSVGKGLVQPIDRSVEKARIGQRMGKRVVSGFGKALKLGAATTVTAAAGAIGTALVQGFGRLQALENARATLEGLGHSAQGVETIMDDALASVKGTAFGMGEAATTAASAVAAGVKPGKDLQRTLTLVGDAAQIAQTDMATMGSIVNKVATSDMMQMDVANQLMDAGIPILQMVADEMGVTATEARKMASEGKVSFEIFQDALETGVGGAALKSGETLAGAFANTKASLGRIGASLLEPLYALAKDFLNYAMDTLGPIEDWAQSIQPIIERGMQSFVTGLKGTFDWIGQNADLIKGLAVAIAGATAAWIAYIAAVEVVAAVRTATGVVKGFSLAMQGTEKAALILRNSNSAVTAGSAAYRTLLTPVNMAKDALQGFRLAQSGVTTGLTLGSRSLQTGAAMHKLYDGAAKGAAAAQRAFNIATANVGGALMAVGRAMKAHPIMAIAGVLAAAAAGLAYFFTQTEAGQKIWASLKEAMQPVADVIMPMLADAGAAIGDTFGKLASTAAPVIEKIATNVGEFAAAILPALMDIGSTILDALLPVFETLGNFIMAIVPTLMKFGQVMFDALVPVFQEIGEALAPMIEQLSESLAPLLPMFAEAGQQIAEAFAPVIDQVMNELVPAFAELWQALSGIIPQLIDALAPILPLIAEAFAQLVAALAPLVPMLVQALAPIIPMIADAFGLLLQSLLPVVATLLQSLLPMLPLLVQVFSDLVGAILPLVPLLIEALAPIIPLIVNAFMMLVEAVMPLIPLLIGSLVPVLVQLVTIAAELVAALLPVAITFVQAIIPAVLAVLPVLVQLAVFIIQTLVPVIQAILNVVVTVFEALAPIISAALTIVQGIIQTITAAITGDWSGAWDGIKMILSGAWDLMKSIVRGALNIVWSIISNALGLIRSLWNSIWNALASTLSWVWNTLIKPVFTALGEYLKWVYDAYISPVISWILTKWESMKNGLVSVYNQYIKPMFDRFGKIVTGLKDKFETAVKNIKKAWNQVKRAAASPIHFVIDSVINKGLIKGFNKLVDWIPGIKGLSDVPIPGWMTKMGFAEGGWTGHGTTYQPAGIVHADEFVVRKLARNRFERENPGLLDHVNRHGTLAGYSGGGLVRPVNGRFTSGFGAGRGRYPHAGVDWAVPIGTPVKAALAGTALGRQPAGRTGRYVFLSHPGNRNTYYGHLSRPMVSAGDSVAKGQVIGLSGNTGRSTGPHLHFETWTGGKPVNPLSYMGGLPASADGGESDDGGWFDVLAPVKALRDGVVSLIEKAFPDGGIFVDAGIGAAKWGFNKVIDRAEGLLGGSTDAGEDSASGSGSVQKQVKDIAAQYGWASGSQWSALSKIISKESSWNPNAANPSSSARGLFQMIAANRKANYKDIGGHTKDGLGYIRNRYGTPSNALAFHNRNNWYADGGLVTKPDNFLYRDNGGNLPPGWNMVWNNTGRDEAILNHQQWSDISTLAKAGGGGERHYHYHSGQDGATIGDFIRETDHYARRLER